MKDILEEALPALQDIVKSGRARYIGISGYPLSRLWDVINKTNIKLDFVLCYGRDTLIDSSLDTYYPLFKVCVKRIFSFPLTLFNYITAFFTWIL